MPRGRFRLGRVARLNQQLRREKEREVKNTLASLERVQAEARATEAAQEKVRRQEQDRPILDARDLQLFRRFEAMLATTEANLRRSAEILGGELEEKRAELIEKRREEKKFDNLRETHDRRVEEEVARQGHFLLDEMALVAHTRRKRNRDEGPKG